jgi:hypothetical protein
VVSINTREEKQAAKKLRLRAARAPESLCTGKETAKDTEMIPKTTAQTRPKQQEEITS